MVAAGLVEAEAVVEGVTMVAFAAGVDALVCRLFRGDLCLGSDDSETDDLDRLVGVRAAATVVEAVASLSGWDMVDSEWEGSD